MNPAVLIILLLSLSGATCKEPSDIFSEKHEESECQLDISRGISKLLEIYLRCGSVHFKQVQLSGKGERTRFFRTISDGKDLIKAYYSGSNGEMTTCETNNNSYEIRSFTSTRNTLNVTRTFSMRGSAENITKALNNHGHTHLNNRMVSVHDLLNISYYLGECKKWKKALYSAATQYNADDANTQMTSQNLGAVTPQDDLVESKESEEREKMLLSRADDPNTGQYEKKRREKRAWDAWEWPAVAWNTEWCGPGNSAANYDDLGEAEEADRCCREHDHCPTFIEAGQNRFNLLNNRRYTISECSCDHKLLRCLRTANTPTSRAVIEIYFEYVAVPCIKVRLNYVCRTWDGVPYHGCGEKGFYYQATRYYPKEYMNEVLANITTPVVNGMSNIHDHRSRSMVKVVILLLHSFFYVFANQFSSK